MNAIPSQDARSRWLPYIVAATFFMEYLDSTIVATALPRMAESFGVGVNALSLGVTAYMLALAVFIPVSGWIADRYGSRSVYASAIVVFTLASVLCGLCNDTASFTAARVLQGMGGAMMVPVGRLIVVRNTEKSRLMAAISTITWPAIAAPVIGPPLGGFITTYASWRWIFLINVPLGLAVLAVVFRLVRNERGDGGKPLDWIGFLLSGLALTAVMYGTELASQEDAPVGFALALIALGVGLGYLVWWQSRRTPHPLIDYSTLQVPSYSVTVITGSVSRIGIGAVPYLLPLLFQIGFGLNAFQSGLLLLASAIGNFGMKALTTPILSRFGFRNVAVVNVALAGVFIAACGWLTPATPLTLSLAVVFLYGVTRSMQFSTLATLAYADIPPQQMSTASTLWSAAQQMTIGMGIAFGALALRAGNWLHGGGMQFSLADFRFAFVCAGVLTLVSVFGYVGMARDAGSGLRTGKA
ncbi:MFS transporter [Noviherbaspirillum pedocola]|uniref:MFS transporter n=1 Tax=Noviherbaspirillum pedocola TaxID=2801341 RepID=A0A934SVD1_9BURK|nr:MFS transporter [Noviherbaspirillum pedocola]MBK4733424.1 MFS transporter [Noviherbaspirillum pedocola]